MSKLVIPELEQRTCAGGCDKTFKCMPGSRALYARHDCKGNCPKEPSREKLDKLAAGRQLLGTATVSARPPRG